jgi:signal transduction histidine kinase
MSLTNRLLGCGTALAALAQSLCGQPASPWRAFRAMDGLPEAACGSVTVGPQGAVLVRHFNQPFITKLDGYDPVILPAPPTSGGRVYESPAGQLWAASTNGLYEFTEGEWYLHAVPEIAADHAAFGPASPHGPPLHPVRQGRVLFLLREQLMLLNAEVPELQETEILRTAQQTRLGYFLGLTPAPDGSLWISGAHGLARLPPPIRSLRPDTAWEEFVLPPEWALQNLREPRADDAGGITALAESATGEPVLVYFDGDQWTRQPIEMDHVIIAWTGPDAVRWAISTNALYFSGPGDADWTREDNFTPRWIRDAAPAPGGFFWLATSGGLFRHAPPVWRAPPAVAALREPIRSITEDGEGQLWFATDTALHLLAGDQIRTFPFRQVLHPDPASHFLTLLANGTILVAGKERLLQFDPTRGVFASLPTDTRANRLRFLGPLNDRSVCVQRLSAHPGTESLRLEIFDGTHYQALPVTPPFATIGATVLAVFQSRNGDLWLGGDRSVACYREGQWRDFTTAPTAPEGAWCFAEAADGRIWCATTDQVWEFNGRHWSILRTGFETIHALSSGREGALWIAANNGLHRFVQDYWLEISAPEGLPESPVFSLLEDRRGQLWVGTSQGLSRQHPEADLDPPRTEISTLTTKPIEAGGAITLDFRGRDKWKFTPQNRLLYSYRLDEEEWSPFRETTTVTFTDLRAGRHVFQVRALDRNGNLESRPAQQIFMVALPWYREGRLLAIALAGLGTALFFAVLAFNRHLRLRRSYAEVEQQVALRTRELEQASRELLHSQKMKALGTLAAGIAHDFNNILSIIKGSAQIIEDNLDQPQKVRRRVDRIKTVVDQGAGLVRAMLGFSRGSAETPESYPLNAVVDDTLTLLGDRFLREVEIRFDPAPELPPVRIVKDFVQQILLNFLFNAAEAMSERKRVVVRTARVTRLPADLALKPAAAPDYVSVSVQDFGCGISAEHLSRLFEPFFTTKAFSTRRGTGLGLSMAYELAGRLQAGLAVESVVGQGSVFTLLLPVHPPASETQSSTGIPRASSS